MCAEGSEKEFNFPTLDVCVWKISIRNEIFLFYAKVLVLFFIFAIAADASNAIDFHFMISNKSDDYCGNGKLNHRNEIFEGCAFCISCDCLIAFLFAMRVV